MDGAVRLYRVDEGHWPPDRRVDADNVDRANDINKRIVIKTARHFASAPSTRAASDQHRTRRFRFSSQVDAENMQIVDDARSSGDTERRARTPLQLPCKGAPDGISSLGQPWLRRRSVVEPTAVRRRVTSRSWSGLPGSRRA
jgi:hypothetical protein